MIGQAERLIELDKLIPRNKARLLPKLISFSSGKGGTGKTFLSLNIAYALSRVNKRILYIDLDLNFANANLLLNIIPEYSIDHFLNRKKLFGEIIHEYNSNLHIIFGLSGEGGDSELSTDNLELFFSNLTGNTSGYDHIIIDTGSGGSRTQIRLLSYAALNIVVTQPEPTAILDAYVIIKLLNGSEYRGKNMILMNKCANMRQGNDAFSNIKTAAGHFLGEQVELLGLIPDDKIAGETIINQRLLREHYPEHRLSHQIDTVASTLSDFAQMANIPQGHETFENV